tara:strand:- start:8657 stop:8797 length:141 start_codon:yes stop_codon:yes gene_type:complete
MSQGKKISVQKRWAIKVLSNLPIKKIRIAKWLKIHRQTLYRYERKI